MPHHLLARGTPPHTTFKLHQQRKIHGLIWTFCLCHKIFCIRFSVAHCGWTYYPHQRPSSDSQSQKMSRRHNVFDTPLNTLSPAIRQNIHGTTEPNKAMAVAE
jgi:hypothetical protein